MGKDYDWYNNQSKRFNISDIENKFNADKLFVCFLLEIEKRDIDPYREFTIEEIVEIIPLGTAGIDNKAAYGYSIMSMLAGQKDRDYIIFTKSGLKEELTLVCNNMNRDNYYWEKEHLQECCKINTRYIKDSSNRFTKLTDKDYKDFLIFLYFGKNDNYLDNCIDRAYRDFNRTLHDFGNIEKGKKKEIYGAAKDYLKDSLIQIQNGSLNIKTQSEFDVWHKKKCFDLVRIYKDCGFNSFHIGQAQKWINMTLKYIFVHDKSQISGFEDIYGFCHIPIDNIILSKLDYNFFDTAWSRIDDYEIYFKFQKYIRNKVKPEVPLDFEFRLFME